MKTDGMPGDYFRVLEAKPMDGGPKAATRKITLTKMMLVFKLGLYAILALLVCLHTSGILPMINYRILDKAKETQGVHYPDLYEASVLELRAGLDAGHFSCVDLVKVCTSLHTFFFPYNDSQFDRHTLLESRK